MRLGVRVDVAELDGVDPGASVGVGVSVIVGVPVGVGELVGVPVGEGVGVPDEVGVGVREGVAEGTTTLAGCPTNFICIAIPSPGISTVTGVDPQGIPVGPCSPRNA